MAMRKVKIRTVEDMMALPEGEWVEVPDGLDLEVTYDGTVRVERNRVTVQLPKGALGRFAQGNGDLSVRVHRGQLIIERRPARRRTSPARRVRSA